MDGVFGTRFVGARTPAWHVKGTVVLPDAIGKLPSVEEMVKLGGIDFTYAKAPIGYTTPSGLFVASEDKEIILRSPVDDDPIWRELGVVSTGYNFIQNVDLARGLDNLTKETGWQFETVGALGYGELVFMTLKTGQRSVFGDNYNTGILVADGKAATRALTISVITNRVVCQNTLAVADATALMKFKISHDGQVQENYDFWLELIGALQTSQDEMFARLEELASVKITDAQAKELIARAYPMPQKNQRVLQAEAIRDMQDIPVTARATAEKKLESGIKAHEAATRRVELRREGTYSLYERINKGQEQGSKVTGISLDKRVREQIAKTPYAVLNAVTEMADWGGAASAEDAASSSLFGEAANVKERAFEVALEFVRS